MPSEKIALFALRHGAGKIERRGLDTLAAAALLFDTNIEVFRAALDGVDQGRCAVDTRLVLALYRALPDRLKLQLAASAVCSSLSPSGFNRLFRDALTRPMTPAQRRDLGHSLRAFLGRHERLANRYRDVILAFLHGKAHDVCMVGLILAGFLRHLAPEDLARMRKKLSASSPYLRMNAHNGLCELAKHYRALSPQVQAFLRDAGLRALVRERLKHDPSEDVRACARFLLKALQQIPPERPRGGR